MEPQPGLAAFLERFKWMTAVLVDEDACQRIAYENVEDARREGIDYLELRFSPWFMAEPHGLDPAAVVGALADGVINTDDPAISGIDLPHEYTVAAPRAGLSNGQIQQAQKNALQLAFLSAGERTALARARLALTSSEVGCGPADKRPGRYAAPPV